MFGLLRSSPAADHDTLVFAGASSAAGAAGHRVHHLGDDGDLQIPQAVIAEKRTFRTIADLAKVPEAELAGCLTSLHRGPVEARRQHAAALREKLIAPDAPFEFEAFTWQPKGRRGESADSIAEGLGPETPISELPVRPRVRFVLQQRNRWIEAAIAARWRRACGGRSPMRPGHVSSGNRRQRRQRTERSCWLPTKGRPGSGLRLTGHRLITSWLRSSWLAPSRLPLRPASQRPCPPCACSVGIYRRPGDCAATYGPRLLQSVADSGLESRIKQIRNLESLLKALFAMTVVAAALASTAAHADADPNTPGGMLGQIFRTVVGIEPVTSAVADAPAQNDPLREMTPLNPASGHYATSMGERRRGDYSAAGLTDAAIARYEDEKRNSMPSEAADRACRGAASFPRLQGPQCLEYLKPRVDRDTARYAAEAERERQTAADQAKIAEAAEKQRFADPKKSADNLARAEKRFATAVAALKKARPETRGAKIEAMSELSKSWCRGVVNDSKYPSGSTEARMILTDCWAARTNSAAEEVEAAAALVETTPLR